MISFVAVTISAKKQVCLELGVMVSRKVTPGRGLGVDAGFEGRASKRS